MIRMMTRSVTKDPRKLFSSSQDKAEIPAAVGRRLRTSQATSLTRCAESITLRENGRERRITKQRAFIKALTSLAIKGDIRAINALVACARNFAPEHTTTKSEELDPEDLDILENFIRRKRKTGEDAERESSKPTTARSRRDHRN